MLNLNVEDHRVKTRPLWTTINCCQRRNWWKVNKLFTNDRHLSVDFIAESAGISTGSEYSILAHNLLTKILCMITDCTLSDAETSASLHFKICNCRWDLA